MSLSRRNNARGKSNGKTANGKLNGTSLRLARSVEKDVTASPTTPNNVARFH